MTPSRAPRRRCPRPDCPNPAPCPEHQTRDPRPAGGPNRTFYRSAEWRTLAAMIVDDQRACPGISGDLYTCGKRTTDADHVIPIEDGGAPLDPANIIARCHSCHSRKTRQEQIRRRKANT